MESLLLNILFVSIGAVVGTVGGWLLRGSTSSIPDEQPALPDREPAQSMEHVETLMGRLHQLTSSVAADIGEHNHRVQEINEELEHGASVVTIVEQLVEANGKMQSQLNSAEKRLQSQAKEIEAHVKEARTDALTRLANRRAFDDELRECVERLSDNGVPFCLMMVDVDHFKRFNDTYGHQAGDEVLKGVARVLRREFSEGEVVCRYGGEEFAVIFPGQNLAAAISQAERGRAAIANELFEYDQMDLKVTASAGIAESDRGEPAIQLVRRADDALYVSKANGRNCGYWHDGTISRPIAEHKKDKMPRAPSQGDTTPTASPPQVTNETPATPRVLPVNIPAPSARRRTASGDRIAGLSDRDTLCKDLERRLSERQPRGTVVSLLLISLDAYTDIVQDFGEQAAEMALHAAAHVVKVSKRDMDHAARFDDATFAVLVPGTNLPEALTVAERIRGGVADCRLPLYGSQLAFTVSIGVTTSHQGDNHDSVLVRAYQALNEARAIGGNQVHSADTLTPQAD